MKLQDKETLNVADAVKDVLEGKVKKEEAKYPHDMFHPKTGEKVVAKNEKDHEELSKKGYTHEKPDVDEAGEPEAKGEKEFKDKHKVKKTGADEKGQVTSEQVAFAFDTQKAARDFGNKVDGMPMNIVKVGSGKYYVVELRQGVDKKAREKAAQIAVKIGLSESYLDEDSKEEGNAFGKAVMAAKEKGDKTFVFAGKKYDVKTKSEVKDEDEDKEVEEELSPKQKKYRAFFDKALKKFGVKSPDELEGDKKKEFFDYVDANYEADNESD
tara:strand:+ start:554 stop:1360 length:807 start_codon:yes stop_codon:yes gene_type:complete